MVKIKLIYSKFNRCLQICIFTFALLMSVKDEKARLVKLVRTDFNQ